MSKQLVSDSILVRQYLQGEESALSELVNRHKRRIYGYINKQVDNVDIANDIFQETFFSVIVSLKKGEYKESNKFLTWVLFIAHHKIVDSFRTAERRIPTKTTVFNSEGEEVDILPRIRIPEESVENLLIRKEFKKRMRKLIRVLSLEQRQVVILRHVFGMSFQEIAEQVDVSTNTALGRMQYALKNLNGLIAGEKINFEDKMVLPRKELKENEIYFDSDTIKV